MAAWETPLMFFICRTEAISPNQTLIPLINILINDRGHCLADNQKKV